MKAYIEIHYKYIEHQNKTLVKMIKKCLKALGTMKTMENLYTPLQLQTEKGVCKFKMKKIN